MKKSFLTSLGQIARELVADATWREDRLEREFNARYPGTPYIYEHLVQDRIASIKNKEQQGIEMELESDVLAPVGLYLRRVLVDLVWRGNSSSGCWEYSRSLRDIYNHLFQSLNVGNVAELVSGNFGCKGYAGHHWVEVFSTEGTQSDRTLGQGLYIVDGTADQFKLSTAVEPSDRADLFPYSKFLIFEQGDSLSTKYYHPQTVSPVPPALFVEKSED